MNGKLAKQIRKKTRQQIRRDMRELMELPFWRRLIVAKQIVFRR
jgi:hypothetical protein